MGFIKPDQIANRIHDIDIMALKEKGIKIIFVDLDNTLVPYLREEVSVETLTWLDKVRKEKLEIFILSNAPISRVQRMKDKLNVNGEGRVFKPILRSIKRIINKRKLLPTQVALIGDQIFTDVLLGKREMVYTILVRPSSNRDFFLTKVSRLMESVVRRFSNEEKT